MKIYHYDAVTGHYKGESEAEISPLDAKQGRNVWIIPANATDLEPPEQKKNKMVVFEAGAWQSIDILFAPENEQPALTNEEKMSAIRVQRDRLLAECDWTQLNDAPLTDDERIIWAGYRFILRNFPVSVDLDNVVWPSRPAL
jgi:hypothetical protein